VDAASHPELFWGLRGGGGNFGIVTEFEFVLHPEPGQALSVEFLLPVSSARDAMRSWRDAGETADRRATWNATIVDRTLSLGFVWVGAPAVGRALADRLGAELASSGTKPEPVVDELSYLRLQSREDDIEDHAWRRYWKGHYFTTLRDEVIDAVLARDAADLPNVSLQAYGGAISDVPADATAFARRDTTFEFVAASRWTDPAEDERRMAAARRYASSLDRYANGAYVNALGDDGAAEVSRAYPAGHLARLRSLKHAYDPGNVFRLNHNITPGRS
jgi:FAD/FMN-containing dehydrogenase